MIYDLSNPLDKQKFSLRCVDLTSKGAAVELVEKATKTPSQNRYLHMLIGVVALETGNNLEDVKREYFKKIVNPELFVYRKTDKFGNEIEVVRSITDPSVTREKLSVAIDRFKKWGSDNRIYMPNPEDTEILRQIEIEMGRQQTYL